MVKKAEVCVITVNYKGAEDTAACVASLQALNTPVLVVVVDNTPNDPELEEALATYPDVKIIYSPENLGFGRGNNLGIDWALVNTDCEYIFILNNDAMVLPNTIEKLLNTAEAHPEAGIISPRIVLAEEPEKLWYGGGEVDWKRGGGKVAGVLGAADAPLAMKARHVSFASGCAMFFKRDVLQKEKGFDPRFFMYEEDLELSLRVQQSGWKIWYEPEALVQHVGQGSSRKEGAAFVSRFSPLNPNLTFLVYEGVKNTLLNMRTHAQGRNRAKFLLFYPVFLTLKFFQWIVKGRWDAVWATVKAIKDYRLEK